MLGGWNGDHPPRDDDGLLEFARSLEAPDIYTFIRDGVPFDAMTLRECLDRGVRKGDSLDAIANRFREAGAAAARGAVADGRGRGHELAWNTR